MTKKEIDLRKFEDVFFLYFGVDEHHISAETLANSLLNFTNGLKRTDNLINVGHELEIIVEALEDGSFKVKLRQVRKSLKNVFSKENVTALSISLLACAIWDFSNPDAKVTITVNTNEYIVETKDERIILPREAEKYINSVKSDESIKKSIEKTFEALDSDKKIQSFEISKKDTKKRKDRIVIDRPNFQNLKAINQSEIDEKTKVSDETLIIIKAILEKGKRKWEFLMDGNRISAPIIDEIFFDEFIAHKITIGPGDALKVKLLTTRKLDPKINLYVNSKYEVIEVVEHIPQAEQLELL